MDWERMALVSNDTFAIVALIIGSRFLTTQNLSRSQLHVAIQLKKEGLHVSIVAILNFKVGLLNEKEANLNITCCAAIGQITWNSYSSH